MFHHQSTPWTDDNVARLKQLWADGDSCSQIGIALGLTRNSIIGKVHRLGLPERLRTLPFGQEISARPKRRHARRYPTIRYQVAPPKKPSEPQAETACGLLDLDNTKCRWPNGDPQEADFHFCGGTVGHGSYCAFHHRIAYAKPVERSIAPSWTIRTGRAA